MLVVNNFGIIMDLIVSLFIVLGVVTLQCSGESTAQVPDLARGLTLPSLDAINYYDTEDTGVTRSRFSRPVRQVKYGPGFGPIPVIGGNSYSNSQTQAITASVNFGPIGASLSTANAQSSSIGGAGYPGIGSHFGGPIGYGQGHYGPGFGIGNSHSLASAAASSGAGGGGIFGGPSFSQSQASASAGSIGFGGGGYPHHGGLGGYYPGGGYGHLGGGYGYPGGGFGYPGGYHGVHHGGYGYPGGHHGGFGYPAGHHGLYPGGYGHHPGGSFLGYGRGGLRSASGSETKTSADVVAVAGAGAGGVSSNSIKF